MEQFTQLTCEEHPVRISLRLIGTFGRGIVEHAGAKAHSAVVALKNIVVFTPLASLPKLFVVGQFRKCHRLVAYAGVELHHRERGGDAENFGKRKTRAGKFKRFLFDAGSKPEMSVGRIDDKSRRGNIIAMSPAFYLAESYKFIAVHRNYGLSAGHLR